MRDVMTELGGRLAAMRGHASYAEVSDTDYIDVLSELFAQLRYAQERIRQLEVSQQDLHSRTLGQILTGSSLES